MKELFAALSKAQAEFPPIEKNKRVKVTMKNGNTFWFDYADLTEIVQKTKGICAKYGLCVNHKVIEKDGVEWLETTLGHSSGEKDVSSKRLPPTVNPQEFGTQLTYYKRYQHSAILGIVSDDDLDANDSEETNTKSFEIEERSQKPKQEVPKFQHQKPTNGTPLATQAQLNYIQKLEKEMNLNPQKINTIEEASKRIQELNDLKGNKK